jgi:HK97 family phage major capsid protein
MGAETLDGLIGDVKFSKEGNSPSFVWEGETDVANESTPTFSNVTLSPNRGGTYIDVSNQAMKQTSPSVEQRVRKQLIGAVQRGLEGAAIEGAPSGPSGILDVATIVSGTAGHALVVDLETAVAVDDADIGSLGYLTNAKGRGLLKQIVKDSGSGNYVWEDGSVNSYDARVTNLITETASGAPEESPLIFGNFADLMMGMWGGIEILVDPFTQATSGMTRLVTNVYADVQIMHDESFSYAEIETTS